MNSNSRSIPIATGSLASRPTQLQTRMWARMAQAVKSHLAAVMSGMFLVVMLLAALGAPIVGRYDPTATDLDAFEQPPSAQHWLGTDDAGRDVWSRLIWGARNSLFVGVVAVALAMSIGVVVGALSGYYGGVLDAILMRITDGFLAFPGIVLMLMLASMLGPSITNVVVVIGLLSWTGVARLVRGLFLSLREREWLIAARSIGVTDRRLIFRHLLPHTVSPVIVTATFQVAGAILTEASLSFLGLGVRPPAPSWGSMLASAQSVHVMQALPWAWLPPGMALVLVVLSVNYLGEDLQSALAPERSGWGRPSGKA